MRHRKLSLPLWQYEQDDEAASGYRRYLRDHDASDTILYADDMETWLEWNTVGQDHAARIEDEACRDRRREDPRLLQLPQADQAVAQRC